jgi:hypothetical protein
MEWLTITSFLNELMKDKNFKSISERLRKIGWDGDGASNGIL